MRLCMIAAATCNNLIGINGALACRHLPDMRFFRKVTMGHPIIFGRKTWEEAGTLPGRTNIVVSRSLNPNDAPHNVVFVNTPEEALAAAIARTLGDMVFVAGGAEIYKAFEPHYTDILLTRLDTEPLVKEGDTPTFINLDFMKDYQVVDVRNLSPIAQVGHFSKDAEATTLLSAKYTCHIQPHQPAAAAHA